MITFLIIALVAGIVLIAVIDGLGKRPRGGRRSGTGRSYGPAPRLDRDQIAGRWVTIQAMAADGGGNGLRQAISEADKLFDQVMRQSGLSGETMGERLKNARGRFPDRSVYDGVWRAHKLRNALAHEIGFDLVPSQARAALSDFEQGLKTLGVL